jgi:hypothetical protein
MTEAWAQREPNLELFPSRQSPNLNVGETPSSPLLAFPVHLLTVRVSGIYSGPSLEFCYWKKEKGTGSLPSFLVCCVLP